MKFALDQLGPRAERTADRRRAVVLMSDGVDNRLAFAEDSGSSIDYWELVEAVRNNDAMMVPIYIDTQAETYGLSKEIYENARKTLRLLADESGGLYYRARKISDLNGVYEQVINDLGRVYSLGYRPTNEKHDGSWRKVKIELLNHPELVPRTRTGYYAN
jgi:VWFA-related protein